MKLSIVTINYNDANGLRKTLASVASQSLSPIEVEHIIIDGGSTDGSVDVIRDYEKQLSLSLRLSLNWISEKDKGIYNAIDKGILMATGDYIQILNSGDILANEHVIEDCRLKIADLNYPEIMYGNMIKAYPDGKKYRDTCGGDIYTPESFLYFYKGTLNHDSAWIRRDLFDRFGLYDEDMRICSDWKWYVDAIALGGVKPVYVDIDMTIFDMNGISESGGKNKAIIQKERRDYMEKILPASVLRDYDMYSSPMDQYRRLRKHHLWGFVYFIERVLFKLEKWGILQ